jgi:hypothetical protein
MRIRDYFQYLWSRHKDFATQAFLDRLPSALRTKIACLVRGPTLYELVFCGPAVMAEECNSTSSAAQVHVAPAAARFAASFCRYMKT